MSPRDKRIFNGSGGTTFFFCKKTNFVEQFFCSLWPPPSCRWQCGSHHRRFRVCGPHMALGCGYLAQGESWTYPLWRNNIHNLPHHHSSSLLLQKMVQEAQVNEMCFSWWLKIIKVPYSYCRWLKPCAKYFTKRVFLISCLPRQYVKAEDARVAYGRHSLSATGGSLNNRVALRLVKRQARLSSDCLKTEIDCTN